MSDIDLPRTTTAAPGRPDVHNSEVDAYAASRNLCGMTHLNTGHVCLLPERHPGGCEFVAPTSDGMQRGCVGDWSS